MKTDLLKTYKLYQLWCYTVIVLLLHTGVYATKKDNSDMWKIRETMVTRLSGEWYKIGVLKNEISGMNDVLSDLRDIELFPEQVIKLSDDRLIAFDKSIEELEKSVKGLSNEIQALQIPLSDAISILKEMVIGDAVEDMFISIENGDMDRIKKMLDIKHSIDSYWAKIDTLIEKINFDMGFPTLTAPHKKDDLQQEFFDILMANLGHQSDIYYKKLNTLKDSLVLRGSDIDDKMMLTIEINHVKKIIAKQKFELAKEKCLSIKKRYPNTLGLDENSILLSRIYFRMGEFNKALKVISTLPDNIKNDSTIVILKLQSLYALQDYEKITKWAKDFDFSTLHKEYRNLAIWLSIESGLASKEIYDYSQLASKASKNYPYYLNVLHGLARSYYEKGNITIAISVFKNALTNKPKSSIDQKTRERIILNLAQIYYEIKEYQKALDNFFLLLNTENYFEEALFGISWCYIKQGSFQKAEITLRKLINQNPESLRAAEAILLMAKRYASKANFEWGKLKYIEKQKKTLNKIKNTLVQKIKNGNNELDIQKYKVHLDTISSFINRLSLNSGFDSAGIALLYDNASSICDLVNHYYKTGSFQEIDFSKNREKLLHKLDSLLIAMDENKKSSLQKNVFVEKANNAIKRLKKISHESTILSANIDIDRYRWENEYLDWKKTNLSIKQKNIKELCKTVTDSTKLKTCKKDIHDISEEIELLVLQGDKLNKKWQKIIEEKCTDILKSPLDQEDEIYLRYHLGELLYQQENDKFSKEYEVFEIASMSYEDQLQRFRDGKTDEKPIEPTQPKLTHEKSIEQFRIILKKYPYSKYIAPVHYSFAWCYNDIGKFDSAVVHMKTLANNFPNSSFTPQAWMYLGEYYFENSKLALAIKAYQSVMKYPESEWFDKALYKLAWTQYRLSNPEKAISSFLALVGLGQLDEDGKALLEKESLDYIAISFSESDISGEKGLERATTFVDKLGDLEKGTQILHRLASVYKEQGRYKMAKNTYKTLLQMYPTYHKSPLVESELMAVEERDLPLDKACEKKIAYFNKYNRKSRWAKAQSDSAIIAEADSASAQQLYDASITYHQLALQDGSRDMYKKAMNSYEKYIRFYPKTPKTNECHYNYAEILFSLGDYYKATEEYMAVSKRYPDSKYRETAAWNAIVASQTLLKKDEVKRNNDEEL